MILHKVHGTPEKFAEMLEKQRPGAIHFSGHGVTAEQIRKENIKFKAFTLMSDSTIEEIFQKGDALVLENSQCKG